MASRTKKQSRVATHRPAARRRRFRYDELIAVDLFSGFGGLTEGIRRAGFTTIMAANHSPYKVEVHEANHPEAEHWIADLVDPESSDYHDARDLPAADLLVAGVSCVNHSIANTIKAYEQGLTLFSLEDPEFDARVTRSERDRATANCVLHYAQRHHPRLILVECTTELTSWGKALPGRPKVGDGSTYRYWLKQFDNLGYDHKVLYLNSQFFGVGQSRDRLYIAMWDRNLPAPDLEHRPISWCARCDQAVEGIWSWRTGVPATGSVRYGRQYDYRCPRCRTQVTPSMTPSLDALDLTNLGVRIGDKPVRTFKDGWRGPLARPSMERAERCRQRFSEFPAVLLPAKSVRGTERHLGQPMATQTSQQETAILSTGTALTGHVIAAHRHNGDGQHILRPMDTVTSTHEKAVLLAAVNNYQGAARGLNEPLPTQAGSETLSLLSAGIMPYRKHTVPTVHAEPMPTVTSDQIPGLLTAVGTTQRNTDVEWAAVLADLTLEDCFFRMLAPHEVGRGCGFDTTFPDHTGEFVVWGSARDQVDGFGNAVSPAVGTWIGERLRAVLDRPEAVA